MGALIGMFFGKSAIKAVVSGVASAVVATGTMAAGACDFETVGSQIGAAAGAFVIGHLATWLAPKNKPA